MHRRKQDKFLRNIRCMRNSPLQRSMFLQNIRSNLMLPGSSIYQLNTPNTQLRQPQHTSHRHMRQMLAKGRTRNSNSRWGMINKNSHRRSSDKRSDYTWCKLKPTRLNMILKSKMSTHSTLPLNIDLSLINGAQSKMIKISRARKQEKRREQNLVVTCCTGGSWRRQSRNRTECTRCARKTRSGASCRDKLS